MLQPQPSSGCWSLGLYLCPCGQSLLTPCCVASGSSGAGCGARQELVPGPSRSPGTAAAVGSLPAPFPLLTAPFLFCSHSLPAPFPFHSRSLPAPFPLRSRSFPLPARSVPVAHAAGSSRGAAEPCLGSQPCSVPVTRCSPSRDKQQRTPEPTADVLLLFPSCRAKTSPIAGESTMSTAPSRATSRSSIT